MDVLLDWVVPAFCVVVVVGIGFAYRRLRLAELRKVALEAEQQVELRSSLLEYVKRHSYQMGEWVPLRAFWKEVGLHSDGDRLSVMAPLLRDVVLLVPRKSSGIEGVAERIIGWVFVPLPERVQLPEVLFKKMYHGSVNIEELAVSGDLVMGNKNMTEVGGDMIGRDAIGGDRIGRDRAGRDVRSMMVGGDAEGSGNEGSTSNVWSEIATVHELDTALRDLTERIRRQDGDQNVVEALEWVTGFVGTDSLPAPADVSRYQRVLDGSGGWIRQSITSIAQRVSGDLASHWIMDVLSL